MRKSYLAILLLVLVLFSLAECKGKKKGKKNQPHNQNQQQEEEEQVPQFLVEFVEKLSQNIDITVQYVVKETMDTLAKSLIENSGVKGLQKAYDQFENDYDEAQGRRKLKKVSKKQQKQNNKQKSQQPQQEDEEDQNVTYTQEYYEELENQIISTYQNYVAESLEYYLQSYAEELQLENVRLALSEITETQRRLLKGKKTKKGSGKQNRRGDSDNQQENQQQQDQQNDFDYMSKYLKGWIYNNNEEIKQAIDEQISQAIYDDITIMASRFQELGYQIVEVPIEESN